MNFLKDIDEYCIYNLSKYSAKVIIGDVPLKVDLMTISEWVMLSAYDNPLQKHERKMRK
jgi:hypothetical protein